MKHVLVTGAGTGIGRATAIKFAKKGYKLTLFGRTAKTLSEVADVTGANYFLVDVSNEEEVKSGISSAIEQNGDISILINNAGAAISAPLHRTDLAIWNSMIGVNLTGVYLCTRYALESLKKSSDSSIVNIASTSGLIGYKYVTAYCAAKHGVIGFTKALALEGIRVNAICPGYTDTALYRDSIKRAAKKTGKSERQVENEFLGGKKLISPDDVASLVLEVSEDQSLNGQIKVIGDL